MQSKNLVCRASKRGFVALIDMNFFNLASRHYRFEGERRSWLNLPGVLDLARRTSAARQGVGAVRSSIVSARAYIGAAGMRVVGGECYTVLPPRYFDAMRGAGIAIEIGEFDRGREVDVDDRLRCDLLLAARSGYDVLLLAGDSDYVQAVLAARAQGAFVTQIGWHLPQAHGGVGIGCSEALRGACDLSLSMENLIGRQSPHESPHVRELFVTTARRPWSDVKRLHLPGHGLN